MNANRHGRISLAIVPAHPTGAQAARLLLCLALLTSALAAARYAYAQGGTMLVLNPAQEGRCYQAQIATRIDKDARFTWTLLDGTKLPPGLELKSADEDPAHLTLSCVPDGKVAGMLAGTPTKPSDTPYTFKVRVTDSASHSAEQWLSIKVDPFPLFVDAGVGKAPVPASLLTPKEVAEAEAKRAEAEAKRAEAEANRKKSFVLTTSTSDKETIALTEEFVTAPPSPSFKPDTDQTNLDALQATIRNSIGTSTTDFKPGDYCVVHLIKWKPINADKKSEPDREIWALFKSRTATSADTGVDPIKDIVWVKQEDPKDKTVFNKRIFGSKRVAVLFANLNTPMTWDVQYTASVDQKIPTPIQHVLDLAPTIFNGLSEVEKANLPTTKNVWGARMMLIKYESSELVVKVNAVTSNEDGRPVEQSKEHTNTFVNEGRYHWDVSVGLPVKSVRELQYKSDGGRVTAESKEKQSVYGFLDIYPWAVDLKGESYLTKPHLVFGVPLASKPLQRPFAGIGSGVFKTPIKFNFFAGIVFIRERVPTSLGEGSTATTGQLEADLRTRWVRKGMFGISFPIGQIKDAIKSK